MADLGTALSAAQTLFAALECSLIKEACSILNYQSDLEGLKRTVLTIKSVLVDAGKKVELSQTDLDYIHKLKDAVYDADDLFDKFITIAARKQNDNPSNKDKVRHFFSNENPIKFALEIFKDVKKIRSHLDAIADDRTKFGFSVDIQPLRRRREETCSYVYANDVVGRDDDATEIIHRLLHSTEDVGFLTIVGIGGLGKTTLAKLVFGDNRIESVFPVKLWVCVADQEGTRIDVKVILLKMLDLVGCKLDNDSTTEKVQTEYQSKLGGKNVLLVLDDVWTEDMLEWCKLREFLMIFGKESRIIVTTRSENTAKIVGDDIYSNTYKLQGLSQEDSWRLFEMSAFRKGPKHLTFDDIGKKIVQKCRNLPLAIKVVGNLLYGQSIDKWEAFEINGFVGTSNNGENEVMSILKFSYDQLEPSLKSCFAYCAIFPKDFIIEKDNLLNLWDAQGYIVPFDNGQSIESAKEEHFSILVKRCFFQVIRKNEYGDVISFKIHDLMHDLAQTVSESEILIMNSSLFSAARHVFETKSDIYEYNYILKSKIRSYLKEDGKKITSNTMSKIVKNWVYLRSLSLINVNLTSLPDTLGNLINLRYLNLKSSLIEKLPNSIAKLHNLRTLNLNDCRYLKELPKKFSKLVNLTHLYLIGTHRLEYMPVGMSKLRSLRVLTTFVVNDETASGRQCIGQLKDLKALAVNLRGEILVKFPEDIRCEEGYNWVDSIFACFEGAHQLKKVEAATDERSAAINNYRGRGNDERSAAINYYRGTDERSTIINYYPYLKNFELYYYKGETFTSILPNLVDINLRRCPGLQQLPLLSELLHLKHLCLEDLSILEYMEEVSSGSSKSKFTFFPSLETLKIQNCGKLKGWWRGEDRSNCQLAFSRLSSLTIERCSELTSFPACARLHSLLLDGNDKALRITTTNEGQSSSSSALSCYNEKSSTNPDSGNTNVGLFQVDHIAHLKPVTSSFITRLEISNDNEVERLSEVEEMFKSCSSLKSLNIWCSKLTSVCGGLEHLTALHSLTLEWCDVLKLEEGELDDSNGMPWRALHSNLRSLSLEALPKVEKLPMGMQYLTSLQDLKIVSCENLKEIPEWVGCLQSLQSLDIWWCDAITSLPDAMLKLTSLQKLHIWDCQGLKEGCREPNGQDWPKIKHIPQIDITLGIPSDTDSDVLDF